MAELPGDPAAAAGPADAFARLRARFVGGLPQRWQEIREAPDAARRRAALHRLAGAAGAYGLDAVGGAARRSEQALDRGDAAALEDALATLRQRMVDAGATVR